MKYRKRIYYTKPATRGRQALGDNQGARAASIDRETELSPEVQNTTANRLLTQPSLTSQDSWAGLHPFFATRQRDRRGAVAERYTRWALSFCRHAASK